MKTAIQKTLVVLVSIGVITGMIEIPRVNRPQLEGGSSFTHRIGLPPTRGGSDLAKDLDVRAAIAKIDSQLPLKTVAAVSF